eukprot:scaffold3163_cov101-Amphora_coffeaeformis.AAC.1
MSDTNATSTVDGNRCVGTSIGGNRGQPFHAGMTVKIDFVCLEKEPMPLFTHDSEQGKQDLCALMCDTIATSTVDGNRSVGTSIGGNRGQPFNASMTVKNDFVCLEKEPMPLFTHDSEQGKQDLCA